MCPLKTNYIYMKKLKSTAQFEDKEFHKELFKNKILDNLTRTSVKVPVVMFVIISIGVSFYSFAQSYLNIGSFILFSAMGFVFFTLLEYLVHRFLYHTHDEIKREGSWQYLFHGVHHDFPKDRERLAMPPIIALVIAAVFFFTFLLIFGKKGLAFFSGFSFAYAFYLCIHYAIHDPL